MGPGNARLPKGDYPFLVLGLPVFSRRAIEALGDLLEGNGEILPTTCEGDEIFFFNVTRVIDALDESDSEVIGFDGSSEIMRYREIHLFQGKTSGCFDFQDSAIPFRACLRHRPIRGAGRINQAKGLLVSRVSGAPIKGQPLIGSGKL